MQHEVKHNYIVVWLHTVYKQYLCDQKPFDRQCNANTAFGFATNFLIGSIEFVAPMTHTHSHTHDCNPYNYLPHMIANPNCSIHGSDSLHDFKMNTYECEDLFAT